MSAYVYVCAWMCECACLYVSMRTYVFVSMYEHVRVCV